jgi:hypothetical protein
MRLLLTCRENPRGKRIGQHRSDSDYHSLIGAIDRMQWKYREGQHPRGAQRP